MPVSSLIIGVLPAIYTDVIYQQCVIYFLKCIDYIMHDEAISNAQLYILSSNFRSCVPCKVSCKISVFGNLKIFWFLLCLFLTWNLIWITSMGNHVAVGGISERRCYISSILICWLSVLSDLKICINIIIAGMKYNIAKYILSVSVAHWFVKHILLNTAIYFHNGKSCEVNLFDHKASPIAKSQWLCQRHVLNVLQEAS